MITHDFIRKLLDAHEVCSVDTIRAHLKKAIQESVDLLIGNTGDLTMSEVSYLRDGHKIDAIKSIRARTGLGLKEAKDLAESFMDKNGIQDQFRHPPT